MKKQKEKKIKKRLNRNGKVIKNNNYGITLMALVITIIVLLILAGISIGMLSGDNSIIKQAGNAKTQTDIAEEKEILQKSAVSAMGKSKYGDLTKEELDDELNKYQEIESSEQIDEGIVVTFKSNRQYLINFDGDVSSYHDIKIGNLLVKDGNTVLAENCKSVQLGKSLTINFEASIPGGSITSITPNISYTTTGERRKTFTIVGKASDGQEITKEYTINLNGYYNIPELKVGDFVNYALKIPTSEELAQLNNDIETYSGATDNTEKTATGSTLLCRVLEMDTNGNPTKLISADGVNTLKLQGANGYNNAVYLINEMCKTLYSGNQGITRSLTIKDLEDNYFSNKAIITRNNYTGGVEYGNTKYYLSSAQYPNIAPEEEKMGIGTTLVDGQNTIRIGGLGLSEQMTIYMGSGNAANLSTTNKGITVTQTYYRINKTSGTNIGGDMYKNLSLYNIMHKSPTLSSDTSDIVSYWLASRCVSPNMNYNYCGFNIRTVDSKSINAGLLFYSSGSSDGFTHAVRPVITLNSGIQAEYVEAYNDTYNTWNLE